MGNYLHKTTKQYYRSTSLNSLTGSVEDYISEPDLSAVESVASKYWKITGDIVSEMSQEEKDAVDSGILEVSRDYSIGLLDNTERLTRQIVRILLDEINTLRIALSLPEKTFVEIRQQIRDGYGS